MSDVPIENETTRPLTEQERELARWMLEHGTSEAKGYLAQLERAEATTWRCKCGCASFNLRIPDLPPAPPGVNILADFVYGPEDLPNSIMIYHSHEILSSVEVSYCGPNPPTGLPSPSELTSAFWHGPKAE